MSWLTQKGLLSIFVAIFMVLSADSYANSEESGKADSKKDGPVYVDFKNIVVPVIKKNGSTGIIAISMMAQVKDEKSKDKVTTNLPRLRDAFIRTLYGNMDSPRYVRENGSLNVESIKKSLMKTADYVMKGKESGIKDILVQNIAQQTY
jgi:flagellar basal body-associated protein FliL